MKKVLAWTLRILCFIVIGAAVFTFVRCLIHINDDHSREALLGDEVQPVEEASETPQRTVSEAIAEAEAEASVEENPSVILYDNGSVTVNHPYTTVTAAFGDIVNSIVAELVWYVDGEEVSREAEHLLVEGSTVSCQVDIDPTQEGADTAEVYLEVSFDGKQISGQTQVTIERLGSADSVVIQTEEISVTADRDTAVYWDEELTQAAGEMAKDDAGLMLDYTSGNSGLTAIKLQLPDGSSGWVSAGDVTITDENCTTDEDYTEDMKVRFVNSMGYDSTTNYLVWVSLYTQKVNVFTGYQGAWELVKVVDCASGANTTPTTTGIYTYDSLKDRWDLGSTYVEPVMIYNGGEAITSQPYNTKTGKIEDDTMGEPASGGSVRLVEADILWMAENVPVGTLIVVY